GIIAGIVLEAAADFEHDRIALRAVLQAMAVGIAGLEARAIAGAQNLFARIGDQHDLAGHHEDEFVLAGMPVALRRPDAWRDGQEVDTELRQAGRVAKRLALPRLARCIVRGRIAGPDLGHESCDINAFAHAALPRLDFVRSSTI